MARLLPQREVAAVEGLPSSTSTPAFPHHGRTLHVTCESFCWLREVHLTNCRASDNAHGRIFGTELPDNQGLTVEGCVQSCSSQNFTLAGMEFAGMTSPCAALRPLLTPNRSSMLLWKRAH